MKMTRYELRQRERGASEAIEIAEHEDDPTIWEFFFKPILTVGCIFIIFMLSMFGLAEIISTIII